MSEESSPIVAVVLGGETEAIGERLSPVTEGDVPDLASGVKAAVSALAGPLCVPCGCLGKGNRSRRQDSCP